jgi:hypothetical protein
MRRLLSAHVSLDPRPLRAVVRHGEGSSHQNLPKMVHAWVSTRGWALRQVRNLTKLVEQRLRVFEAPRLNTSPVRARARARAQRQILYYHVPPNLTSTRARTREGTARRASGPAARAAKRKIPAHDLAYQPILGRRLGSSGLAGQGAGDVPVLKNNQRKSNGRCSRGTFRNPAAGDPSLARRPFLRLSSHCFVRLRRGAERAL